MATNQANGKHRALHPPSPEQVAAFIDVLGSHRGKARAIVARDLAIELNLTSDHAPRILRALSHAATEQGEPVCAGDAGYWLAASPEELDQFANRIQSQATEMFDRSRRLRSLADTMRAKVYENAEQELLFVEE